ncbi:MULTISPECIES: PspC domain-containing protein [Bacillus]|uniref:PspC domain-containing protein n=1 Tax=Bacillus cereus TaxID=1396 RepID=A0A2C1LRU4_BACCE|nr:MULTISPECIES: PspC domain-containing protein [Bacillus]MDH4420676.1 PspC domain-containing protein [Bacillus cereus]PER21066.1 PspC domain-containing protein [Bacillus cereus]PFA63384.1 PspC domain-containing protein [Bacillus sp. AFS015896]PGL86773.1 PspC domain-containing protein [Bacillus sp. AFS054943]PGU00485.1 PspC domain-containing protein [Bacillus cereus]
MSKKLCKSETDKMLSGVCGGLGEYFDISSTLIRILWVIAVLCFGTGFLIYLICLLLMPRSY